ncbi:unnamed protein product, partial [marine sediment metagenome]
VPGLKPILPPPAAPPAIPAGISPQAMAGVKPEMIQDIISQIGAGKADQQQPKKKKLSRSSAAFKRWATQPKRKGFKSGRAWEKKYAKGLFEDVQNHYLYGIHKHWTYDAASDQYIHCSEIEDYLIKNKVQENVFKKIRSMTFELIRKIKNIRL